MDFLTTAANNFKYSFQEQLLIFAQKPDATACAEVSWWNKHGRWVNRNTKGIALLVDTDAPYKLRHVFDVSDTNSRAGKAGRGQYTPTNAGRTQLQCRLYAAYPLWTSGQSIFRKFSGQGLQF